MEEHSSVNCGSTDDVLILRSGLAYARNSPSTAKETSRNGGKETAFQSPLITALYRTRSKINSLLEDAQECPKSPTVVELERTRKRIDSIYNTVLNARRNVFGNQTSDMALPPEKSDSGNPAGLGTTAHVINSIMQIIPVFSGEPVHRAETDLHVFLNIAQAYFKTLSFTEQQTFLSLVPKLKLRGIPYEICCNKSFSTFEEFQQTLTDYFFPSKDLSALTHDMQSCRQLHGETVRQYGQRIDLKLRECELFLTQLCKGNNEAVIQEYQRMAIQTFRRGLLSPSLKQYSCILEEKSLAGIIKKVSDLEALENQCQSTTSPIGQYPPVPVNQPIAPTNLPETNLTLNDNLAYLLAQAKLAPGNQVIERGHTGKENARREEVRRGIDIRRPVECYKCGRVGHISRECKGSTVFCNNCRSSNHTTRTCPRPGRAAVARLQAPVKCDFCQRRGHRVEECAAKRQWERKTERRPNQGNGPAPVDAQSDRH